MSVDHERAKSPRPAPPTTGGAPAAAGPVLVISPHLDDGVFSCGQLLACHPRSVVVTAFAGRPPADLGLTAWDADAGFGPDDDVIASRREEDRAALALLAARPVWLDFRDSQYGCTPSEAALSRALEEAVLASGLTRIYFPLGLFHSDHQLVHAASLRLVPVYPDLAWHTYADALYRRFPGLLAEGLTRPGQQGLDLGPAIVSGDRGRAEKGAAIRQYRSQLRALATPGRPGHADALAPECYWRLLRRDHAAGRREEATPT